MTAMHQVVPVLLPGDATSDHSLQLQRLLLDMGFESEIFVQAVHPSLADRARLLGEIPTSRQPDTLWLYQLSAASGIAEWLAGRREPFAINYHNVTPPHFYRRWEPAVAADQRWALRQTAHLADRASTAICDSSFNAANLALLGYSSTFVAPVLVDVDRFSIEPARDLMSSLGAAKSEGGSDWLFIGRIAPHKAQHRVVGAFAAYRRLYDPSARLALVGGGSTSRYGSALSRYTEALGLGAAVTVASGIDHAALVAHLVNADVCVSLSEHEGFCVPILEALAHDLPVVARDAGAVAETLGQGGLILNARDSDDPAVVAAAVHTVLGDGELRARLAIAGRQRLDHFSLANSRAVMVQAIHGFVERAGMSSTRSSMGRASVGGSAGALKAASAGSAGSPPRSPMGLSA